MSDDTTEKPAEPSEPKVDNRDELWTYAALVIGFNECAKTAPTLGDKVYFALRRDQAEDEYVQLGGQRIIDQSEKVVLQIPLGMRRWIRFREKDIELMRQAVADYDAKKVEPSGG